MSAIKQDSCKHNCFDIQEAAFFKLVASFHQYPTRQADNEDIFLTHKYGLRSVHYCGAKCWNKSPLDIKRSPSVNIFCKKVKAYLFVKNYKFWLQTDCNSIQRFSAILSTQQMSDKLQWYFLKEGDTLSSISLATDRAPPIRNSPS